MKSKYLVATLVLVGLQSVSLGNALAEYPSDAEASYNLPALETYADRQARGESSASWGVSRRDVMPHEPFPFGGGFISD